jgi:hypothetical protein
MATKSRDSCGVVIATIHNIYKKTTAHLFYRSVFFPKALHSAKTMMKKR